MTVKAVYPEHYDGFRLRQWLLAVRPDLDGNVTAELGPSLARRWSEWVVPGSVAGVEVVDRMCIRLGLHLLEVPDRLGCGPPNRLTRERLARRKRALGMLAEGFGPSRVAREIGVSKTTVHRWRQEQGEQ